MKLFYICCFLVVMTTATGTASPTQYRVGVITPGVDATVKESFFDFECSSYKKAKITVRTVVTVFTSEGTSFADFSLNTDKRASLKKFSGTLYDIDGNVLRKINIKDLKYTEYNAGLVKDGRLLYYEPKVSKLPYTIEYVYEVTFDNGLINFPSFAPVPGFRVNVENSRYTITVPLGFDYHTKIVNCDHQLLDIHEDQSSKSKSQTYTFKNIPAFAKEPFSPPAFELFPMVAFAPHEFQFHGYYGSLESWEEYSKWQWLLLKDRDLVPAELRQKILSMTERETSDRAKVEVLYNYLGQQTRYVSIQLGIGGWQPMKVEDVHRNKYGDCKALVNYMMAMLKVCGIDSYYSEISTKNKRIWKDFPNSFQTNHIILKVPLEDETLWLECTNPEIPFGYIHRNIAGHDVLVYRDGSVYLETVPHTADSLNTRCRKLDLTLMPERRVEGYFNSFYTGFFYEQNYSVGKADEHQKNNYATRQLNLPIGYIGDFDFKENKTKTPDCSFSFNIQSYHFGNQAGQRILLPLNIFKDVSLKLPDARSSDIHIENGYVLSDTIIYRLPPEYVVESIPEPLAFESPFGSYVYYTEVSENVIFVSSRFSLNGGIFRVSDYSDLKALFDALRIGREYNVVIKYENIHVSET